MKKVKQTVVRRFAWMLTFVMVIAILIITDAGEIIDEGDIIAVVLMIGIFIAVLIYAWYKTITGIGYIEVGEGKLHVVTECRNAKESIKIDEEFRIEDIVRMGYTRDLYGHWIYLHRGGYMSSQVYEVVFELNNGKRIFIDLAYFYTKNSKERFSSTSMKLTG